MDEHVDSLSQKVGLLQVMGHVEGGEAQGAMQRNEQLVNLVFQSRVQSSQGFIQKEEPGTRGEGSSQGHSLLLSAAEPLRVSLKKVSDLQGLDQRAKVGVVPERVLRRIPQPKSQISLHGKVGKNRQILGNVGNPSFFRGQPLDFFLPQQDLPPVNPSQPGNGFQDEGFS